MKSRSIWHVVVGALTLAYGAILTLFWAWVGLEGGQQAIDDARARPGVAMLFVSAALLLLLTGILLCWRGSRRVAAVVTAVTAILLCLKAAGTIHWSYMSLQAPDPPSLQNVIHGVGGLILMALVGAPSALWGIVLAGTAASLWPVGPTEPGTGAASRGGLRWALVRVAVALAITLQLGGIAVLHSRMPDLAGLQGVWRDPVNPKHSYRFVASGDLESWWSSLPHGIVARWERDGQKIRIRPTPDWQQMDDLDGTLEGGTIRWQRIDRKTGNPSGEVSWNRDPPGGPPPPE